jgi:hypothetical protein
MKSAAMPDGPINAANLLLYSRTFTYVASQRNSRHVAKPRFQPAIAL